MVSTAQPNDRTPMPPTRPRALDDGARQALQAIPVVQRGLNLCGIPWVEVETAEADDVIATLIKHARDRSAWIFSTDRDYYQLLDEQVRVLNTAMHPGKRHIGPKDVAGRYGVSPAQWPCFCALKGDPADNIPGVRGIGAATAARLLDGGCSLDDLLASGRLTGAKGMRVQQQWQQVLAWRDLVRMRTNLPLPITPTGDPSPELPKPAEVIQKMELW
ncbi:5'-3' exonuclease H3TH domain-containing protein [Saccharopolyspora sp. NPDC049357]|uniref:5'-3' exonuclease n=1 Tax=Saccharopolyspora sp. NPDC049357 TaxID=3154507 RepID=UPI00341B8041